MTVTNPTEKFDNTSHFWPSLIFVGIVRSLPCV